jgi:hypothetical protein
VISKDDLYIAAATKVRLCKGVNRHHLRFVAAKFALAKHAELSISPESMVHRTLVRRDRYVFEILGLHSKVITKDNRQKASPLPPFVI